MAKKSKSELAEEGKAISETLKAARKAPHNFALFHGKDDLIFVAHRTKNKSAVRQIAKSEGATAKGAVGALLVNGKVADLIVEDPDSTPANFAKVFRKFLIARGIGMKVRLLSETGDVLDDGDEEEENGASGPDELSEDIEVELARIARHFDGIKLGLVRSLNSAPSEFRDKIAKAVSIYKKAIETKNADAALSALKAVNVLVTATPSTVRIHDGLKGAGEDPQKLEKLAGLVKSCAARVQTEPAFLDDAFPEMRDMRAALKAALAKTPAPANAAALLAMKEAMDTMFYDHVDKPPKAHGPQCHGPGLSLKAQEDRILKKKNPRTGKPFKGKPVHKASNFTDKAAFVETETALRTKALDQMDKAKIQPPPKGGKPVRLAPVEVKLSDVLGTTWQTMVQGVKRKQTKGSPDSCVPASWGPDSTGKAIYDLLADGTLRLVTLYPNPIVTQPVPKAKPKPTKSKAKPFKGAKP